MLKSAGFQMISSSTMSFILINQLRIFQIELSLISHTIGRIFDSDKLQLQVYILYSINTRNAYERISAVLKLISCISVLINIYQVMQTNVQLCRMLLTWFRLICNKTNF